MFWCRKNWRRCGSCEAAAPLWIKKASLMSFRCHQVQYNDTVVSKSETLFGISHSSHCCSTGFFLCFVIFYTTLFVKAGLMHQCSFWFSVWWSCLMITDTLFVPQTRALRETKFPLPLSPAPGGFLSISTQSCDGFILRLPQLFSSGKRYVHWDLQELCSLTVPVTWRITSIKKLHLVCDMHCMCLHSKANTQLKSKKKKKKSPNRV